MVRCRVDATTADDDAGCLPKQKAGRSCSAGIRFAETQSMDNLCRFAKRPLAFFLHYVKLRPFAHSVIIVAVLAAVACSVSTQYGVKFLVDTLSGTGGRAPSDVWIAFGLLVSLITADNLLWRLASFVGS